MSAMLPRLFDDSVFDVFDPFADFGRGHNRVFGKHASHLMKTDIRETDTSYKFSIDLPGFKKEDVSAELKDGYLTVTLTDVEERHAQQSQTGHQDGNQRKGGTDVGYAAVVGINPGHQVGKVGERELIGVIGFLRRLTQIIHQVTFASRNDGQRPLVAVVGSTHQECHRLHATRKMSGTVVLYHRADGHQLRATFLDAKRRVRYPHGRLAAHESLFATRVAK